MENISKELVVNLSTESAHPRAHNLDKLDTSSLVCAFVDDQLEAVESVRQAMPQLTRAVNAMWPRIQHGGRLIYVGAGTSGRLGLLDCVELGPTFSWPQERSIALLAGGNEALFQAVEGAEDNEDAGYATIYDAKVEVDDCIIILAASGRTPFCIGALKAAKKLGALTIAVVNNIDAPLAKYADIAVELLTGAEVLAGSTRLKAGTAQKIALNSLSSALMVKLDKVYDNLMVDVKVTNEKLRIRACHLVMKITEINEEEAFDLLACCNYEVKTAVIMAKTGKNADDARQILSHHGSNLGQALVEIERNK